MKLEELVNKNYGNLNENDKYILKYILKNKKECYNLGINELGKRCNVSRSTILRCVKKLGFEGYSEFRLHLKWKETDMSTDEVNNIEKLFSEINQTINYIKDRDFTKICKLIYNADRVFVYGTGASQRVIAQALKQTFLAINKYLFTIEGEEDFRIIIDNMTDDDIVIIISLSGNTECLQKFTSKLSLRGIEYISITKLVNNKLSTTTPYNLYATTAEFVLDETNTNQSFTMYYILIEALFRHYIQYEKEQMSILEIKE
ncbi:MAG: MurR/RpiR family transcriptional regulator [Clostridiaceae bacterium]